MNPKYECERHGHSGYFEDCPVCRSYKNAPVKITTNTRLETIKSKYPEPEETVELVEDIKNYIHSPDYIKTDEGRRLLNEALKCLVVHSNARLKLIEYNVQSWNIVDELKAKAVALTKALEKTLKENTIMVDYKQCKHVWEPDTSMTVMRCDICHIGANTFYSIQALKDHGVTND